MSKKIRGAFEMVEERHGVIGRVPTYEQYGYRHEYRFGVRTLIRCGDNQAMLVNQNMMKCVAFAAARKATDFEIGGTIFFVLHPIEGLDHWGSYAITARHVVEDASRSSEDAKIHLRLNECDGRASWMPTELTDWEFHSDPRVDVAAMPIVVPLDPTEQHGHLAIDSGMFLTQDLVRVLEIVPGYELYFPGLFVRHYGNVANIPILRTGTIAALPTEQVKTKSGLTNVYLAEIRSIGGHSGSPVFVHIDPAQIPGFIPKALNAKFNPLGPPLLGLVHGHFPLRPDQFVASAPSASGGREDFNSGIAAIVPASKIIDVLNQPRFIEDRRIYAERLISSRGTTIPDKREP